VNLEAVVIKTSSSTSRVSWIVAAILVGGAAVPGRLSSQDNAFTNRATTLLQTFQARINDITDDALKVRLKEEITSVTAEAGRLDRLDERIHELKNVIDDLEMQYNNARANAEALQSSFASDRENANTKLNSILKEAQTICSSLGGGWVDETNCMFSCPADNPGPCEAKIAQYNQQAAPLNSTMRKIHEDLNSEQERAEHAAAVASEKQHDWEEKKSELAALERQRKRSSKELQRTSTMIFGQPISNRLAFGRDPLGTISRSYITAKNVMTLVAAQSPSLLHLRYRTLWQTLQFIEMPPSH